MDLIVNILEQASLFALVSMGVYITYKILDFADLSVDGTYPLGACIVGALLVKGVNPWIATLLAMIGGALAGLVTALLHVKLKITGLMSGILVMMGLYSVNLFIMGKSNVPLFNTERVFNNKVPTLAITLIILIVVKVLFDLFMKTKVGFLLTAVGDNEQVVTALGVNKNNIKILALMLSNGLVALSGGLFAQYSGFADVGMGTGIVVKGLACVIIGTFLFEKISKVKATTSTAIGTLLYYTAISIALNFKLNPNYLNFFIAIILVIALSSQSGVFNFKGNSKKKGGAKENAKDQSTIESI